LFGIICIHNSGKEEEVFKWYSGGVFFGNRMEIFRHKTDDFSEGDLLNF